MQVSKALLQRQLSVLKWAFDWLLLSNGVKPIVSKTWQRQRSRGQQPT